MIFFCEDEKLGKNPPLRRWKKSRKNHTIMNLPNLPNIITFSRLLGIPFILYLLNQPDENSQLICLIIFVIVAFTDFLDGYLARKLNQVTELGKFLDPLVDKLLVLAPLLAFIQLQKIPAWGVFIILARELTIAGWRVNQTNISGANIWGKVKTVSQIIAIALLIYPWNINVIIPLIAFWLSVLFTVISGLIYLLPTPATEQNS